MTDHIAESGLVNQPQGVSRRQFLGTAGTTTAILLSGLSFRTLAAAAPGKLNFALGACTSFSNWAVVKAAGGAYVEENASKLLSPKTGDADFEKAIAPFKAAKVPVPACNGFLPGELKLVGAKPNHDEIVTYATKMFERAKALGIDIIVLGSGGSRKVPEGFDHKQAEEQFVAVVKRLAAAAKAQNVKLAMEPLNSSETNFANKLADCLRIARAVDHPGFGLVADFYHMLRADEGAEAIGEVGQLLLHCHIAEKKDRTAPGQAGDDFRPYLRALGKIGYQGRISLECRWKDFNKEVGPAIAELRKQIETA